jgi:hypothetical protein
MPVAPEWIFNLAHPQRRGMLESLTTRIYVSATGVFRNQKMPLRVRLVLPSDEEDELWATQDLTGTGLKIAVGDLDAAPTSGTFTLSWGGDTTTALDHDATEGEIETALNALASIDAAGGVTVARTGGTLRVTWDNNGARAALTCDVTDLLPLSNADIYEDTPGDGDTREVQSVALKQQVYAYAAPGDWTLGATHAEGTLRFNTPALRARFAATTENTIRCTLEVKFAPDGAEYDVVFQSTVEISRDLITDTTTSLPSLFNLEDIIGADGGAKKHGNTAIANGGESVAVAFTTAFSATPRSVNAATVEKPSSGADDVFVVGLSGLSAAGFTAHLSGAAPSAGYKLHWLAWA